MCTIQTDATTNHVPYTADLRTKQPVRVLVVEDEWLIALDIQAALEDGGYTVTGVARSAPEALELATALRPDVATMDIRLRGDCDGILLAQELYDRYGLPSLFVSANSDAIAASGGRGGATLGWISKPMFGTDVVRALDRALGRAADTA